MKKTILSLIMACSAMLGAQAQTVTYHNVTAETDTANLPTVYFIRDINPEALTAVYEATGRKAEGNNVAVKLSTGEAGNPNHISPDLMKNFLQSVNGTIVECNTAYPGKRFDTANHMQTAAEHGFTAIGTVDIMDADGEVGIPVTNGKWLDEDIVGKNLLGYDFLVSLAHFKGHAMAGFGGAMKNISIGIASRNGKAYIHSAGKTKDPQQMWNSFPVDSVFQESMAEASEAVINHFGKDKVLFINVANNLSIDCDCASRPAKAEILDIGIFASTDPIAVDQACINAVENAPDHGKVHLLERIAQKDGRHQLEYAESRGLGSRAYRLVEIRLPQRR